VGVGSWTGGLKRRREEGGAVVGIRIGVFERLVVMSLQEARVGSDAEGWETV